MSLDELNESKESSDIVSNEIDKRAQLFQKKMIENAISNLERTSQLSQTAIKNLISEFQKDIEVIVSNTKKQLQKELNDIKDNYLLDPNHFLLQIRKEAEELKKSREDLKENIDSYEKMTGIISNYIGNDGSEWIKINVGGRVFETYRSTLTQIKNSVIAKMFGERQNMLYRDHNGVFHLDRNPETFEKVLTILRYRGNIPADLRMTPSIYAELFELGLLDAFKINKPHVFEETKEMEAIFVSFRSTSWENYCLQWNGKQFQSSKVADEYFTLQNNNSQIKISKEGYYRITFRCVLSINSTGYSAQLRKNGSCIGICYHYNYSSTNEKSYVFNEIIQLSKDNYIDFYTNIQPKFDEDNNYLSIEYIPDILSNNVSIFQSSSSSSYYRYWNNAIKNSELFTVSSYTVTCTQGGFYRVSARCHTYYNGASSMMYLYLNGNTYACTYQSNGSQQYYGCCNFDELVFLSPNQSIQLYDGGYGSANTVEYDNLCIEPIIHPNSCGYWQSSANQENYYKWNHPIWNSRTLYQLTDNQVAIQVQEIGIYRISTSVTYNVNGNGYIQLYINDNPVSICRMGCYSSNYHTAYINEIMLLNKGDKIKIYTSATVYTSQQYNRILVQKIIT